ncbi:hypothetical protein B296_00015559, partial [Ensete ventricosum]
CPNPSFPLCAATVACPCVGDNCPCPLAAPCGRRAASDYYPCRLAAGSRPLASVPRVATPCGLATSDSRLWVGHWRSPLAGGYRHLRVAAALNGWPQPVVPVGVTLAGYCPLRAVAPCQLALAVTWPWVAGPA